MTSDQMEVFAKNPRFMGLRFPDVSKPETLEKHYVGKLNKSGISLLKGMLEMDPKKRLTALEALSHPYYDSVREPDVAALIKKAKNRAVSQHSTRESKRSRSGIRRK